MEHKNLKSLISFWFTSSTANSRSVCLYDYIKLFVRSSSKLNSFRAKIILAPLSKLIQVLEWNGFNLVILLAVFREAVFKLFRLLRTNRTNFNDEYGSFHFLNQTVFRRPTPNFSFKPKVMQNWDFNVTNRRNNSHFIGEFWRKTDSGALHF